MTKKRPKTSKNDPKSLKTPKTTKIKIFKNELPPIKCNNLLTNCCMMVLHTYKPKNTLNTHQKQQKTTTSALKQRDVNLLPHIKEAVRHSRHVALLTRSVIYL